MDRRTLLKALGAGAAAVVAPRAEARAAPRRIALGDYPVAGFQYHDGMDPDVARELAEGERLAVVREPQNPYDELALALRTRGGAMIGYVPRYANTAPSTIADQGIALSAEIVEWSRAAPPWERAVVRLYLEVG